MKSWLALALVLPLPCGLSACGGSSGTISTEPHPTIFEVTPEAFDRALPCSDVEGALRGYVATLTDVSETTPTSSNPSPAGEASGDQRPVAGFVLPSSGLVPCSRAVAFGGVAPLHSYRVDIQGYDRSDLVQLAAGLPTLLDPETRAVVAPRWSATCEPVQAELEQTTQVSLCQPWSNLSTDPALVSVSLEGLLGEFTCGDAAPGLGRFLVLFEGQTLGEAACGEVLSVELPEQAGVRELEVFAFEAGSDQPSLGGTCEARTAAGITLPATCGPLSDRGGIRVEVAALLETLSLSCQDLAVLEVTLVSSGPEEPDQTLELFADRCRGTASFKGVSTGRHEVLVQARSNASAEPLQVQCTADVSPGFTVGLDCVAPGG